MEIYPTWDIVEIHRKYSGLSINWVTRGDNKNGVRKKNTLLCSLSKCDDKQTSARQLKRMNGSSWSIKHEINRLHIILMCEVCAWGLEHDRLGLYISGDLSIGRECHVFKALDD